MNTSIVEFVFLCTAGFVLGPPRTEKSSAFICRSAPGFYQVCGRRRKLFGDTELQEKPKLHNTCRCLWCGKSTAAITGYTVLSPSLWSCDSSLSIQLISACPWLLLSLCRSCLKTNTSSLLSLSLWWTGGPLAGAHLWVVTWSTTWPYSNTSLHLFNSPYQSPET